MSNLNKLFSKLKGGSGSGNFGHGGRKGVRGGSVSGGGNYMSNRLGTMKKLTEGHYVKPGQEGQAEISLRTLGGKVKVDKGKIAKSSKDLDFGKYVIPKKGSLKGHTFELSGIGSSSQTKAKSSQSWKGKLVTNKDNSPYTTGFEFNIPESEMF